MALLRTLAVKKPIYSVSSMLKPVREDQLPHVDLEIRVPDDSFLTDAFFSEARVLHLLQQLNPTDHWRG